MTPTRLPSDMVAWAHFQKRTPPVELLYARARNLHSARTGYMVKRCGGVNSSTSRAVFLMEVGTTLCDGRSRGTLQSPSRFLSVMRSAYGVKHINSKREHSISKLIATFEYSKGHATPLKALATFQSILVIIEAWECWDASRLGSEGTELILR